MSSEEELFDDLVEQLRAVTSHTEQPAEQAVMRITARSGRAVYLWQSLNTGHFAWTYTLEGDIDPTPPHHGEATAARAELNRLRRSLTSRTQGWHRSAAQFRHALEVAGTTESDAPGPTLLRSLTHAYEDHARQVERAIADAGAAGEHP